MIDVNKIRQEDLNPIYQQLTRLIGLEATVRVGIELGGESIYFPKLDRGTGALIKARDREIVAEYLKKEVTTTKLARKYGLTQRALFLIVKKQQK